MNRLVLASLCALILAAPAIADDLDPKPGNWEETRPTSAEISWGEGVQAVIGRFMKNQRGRYLDMSLDVNRVAFRDGVVVGRVPAGAEVQGLKQRWKLVQVRGTRVGSRLGSARGVRVVHTWDEGHIPGRVEVIRLAFSGSEQALDFATDRTPLAHVWIVDVRGNEVVVINTTGTLLPRRAIALLEAAWSGFGPKPARPLLLGISDSRGNRALFVRTRSSSVSEYMVERVSLARQRTEASGARVAPGATVRAEELVFHWLTHTVVAYQRIEGAEIRTQVGIATGDFKGHYLRGEPRGLQAYAALGEGYGAPSVVLPEFEIPPLTVVPAPTKGFCEALGICHGEDKPYSSPGLPDIQGSEKTDDSLTEREE